MCGPNINYCLQIYRIQQITSFAMYYKDYKKKNIKFKAYNETWLELQVKAADLSTFNIKLLTNPICILADMNTKGSWQNEIDKTL